MLHNKVSFVRKYCLCRRIPYQIKGEALFIGGRKHKNQVCFSIYNHTYRELLDIVDEACVYDDYGNFLEESWRPYQPPYSKK